MKADKKSGGSKQLDPDVRFLLANERTLLAWIRTALAVMGGGVALTQIGGHSKMHTVTGIMIIVLGGFMVSVGYVRFRTADRAIRMGKLPSTGIEPLIQVGAIMLIAVGLVITRILRVWH